MSAYANCQGSQEDGFAKRRAEGRRALEVGVFSIATGLDALLVGTPGSDDPACEAKVAANYRRESLRAANEAIDAVLARRHANRDWWMRPAPQLASVSDLDAARARRAGDVA